MFGPQAPTPAPRYLPGPADRTCVQALCTEASLASLRRHYPQIYDADEKLLIDPGRVRVRARPGPPTACCFAVESR